jgi:hypothetical protein
MKKQVIFCTKKITESALIVEELSYRGHGEARLVILQNGVHLGSVDDLGDADGTTVLESILKSVYAESFITLVL